MKVQKCWTKINISSGAIVLGKTYLHLLKVHHQIWNHMEWMDVNVVPDLPVSWSYLLSITFDPCPSKTRQSEWKQGSANLNSINLNRGQDLDQPKYYAVTKSISNAAQSNQKGRLWSTLPDCSTYMYIWCFTKLELKVNGPPPQSLH